MKLRRPILIHPLWILLAAALLPAQTPVPVVNDLGLVNGASFRGGVIFANATARGSIVSIFGRDFSGTTAVADSLPLPTQLPGSATQVLFNNLPAPLFFVSPTQINAQVPFELPASAFSASLVVRNGDVSSKPVNVRLVPGDPGVFTLLQNGGGPPAVLHPDGKPVSRLNPVKPGGYLLIFATGLGAVSPTIASGQPAPTDPPATTASKPTVLLSARPVTVTFSGLAPGFVGLYQVNVQVPSDFPFANPQVVLMQSNTSPSLTVGGMGLASASPLTAAAGSPDLTITATGLNLPAGASLNFGGRKFRSTVQQGGQDTITATIPAGALRVTGSIPVYTTAVEFGGFQSNQLNFNITGTTIPGTAPALSNLVMTTPISCGSSCVSFSVDFDFQDPDGDIVYNGSAENSARLEIRQSTCFSYSTSGTGLNFPDQTQRRLHYDVEISRPLLAGSYSLEWRLVDQAGNRSNPFITPVNAWLCPTQPP